MSTDSSDEARENLKQQANKDFMETFKAMDRIDMKLFPIMYGPNPDDWPGWGPGATEGILELSRQLKNVNEKK